MQNLFMINPAAMAPGATPGAAVSPGAAPDGKLFAGLLSRFSEQGLTDADGTGKGLELALAAAVQGLPLPQSAFSVATGDAGLQLAEEGMESAATAAWAKVSGEHAKLPDLPFAWQNLIRTPDPGAMPGELSPQLQPPATAPDGTVTGLVESLGRFGRTDTPQTAGRVPDATGLPFGKVPETTPRPGQDIPQVGATPDAAGADLAGGQDFWTKPFAATEGILLRGQPPRAEAPADAQQTAEHHPAVTGLEQAVDGLVEGPEETLARPQQGGAEPAFAKVPLPAHQTGSESGLATSLPAHGIAQQTAGLHSPQPVAVPLEQPATLVLPSGQRVAEQDLMDQVMVRMSGSLDGRSGRATLRLHPEELGELHLDIQIHQDRVRAQLHAQTSQVQEVLERHLPRLRETLEQHGMQVDQLKVSVDSQQAGHGDWQQGHFFNRNPDTAGIPAATPGTVPPPAPRAAYVTRGPSQGINIHI